MHKFITFLALLLICSLAHAQFNPDVLALRDVHVINGKDDAILQHQTIIIDHGKITALGPVAQIKIPDAAVIINGNGRYVMPGLIDAHVHLFTDPSATDYRGRAEHDARDMLLSGITAVRDMAGDARSLAAMARDASLGDIIAPDIYYSSLFAGSSFFNDPRTHRASMGGVAGQMQYMLAVTDSSDLVTAMAQSAGTGATGIKLYARLSGALAKRLTDEAHRQGLRVWSHTDLTEASPLEVINAGVDCISHAGMIARWQPDRKDSIPMAWRKPNLDSLFWDKAFADLPVSKYISAMKSHGTILDATLLVEKSGKEAAGYSEYARLVYRARYEMARRFIRLALKEGVPVCAGTDADEDRFVQRELKLLVSDAGFTPMQAIRSGTWYGARALGIDGLTGSIAVGRQADLLVLDADPSADIKNIDKVSFVVKRGSLYNKRISFAP